MNFNNYLARNLKSYQIFRNITIRQLASELGIPLSTLRTVMQEGNTTMDTAMRIANSLNISLDALISNDKPLSEHITNSKNPCINQIINADIWLSDFPANKRDDICNLIVKIWDVIDESGNNDKENTNESE